MFSGQVIDAIIFIYLGYAAFIGFTRGFFNVFVGIFGIYGASFFAWLFQKQVYQLAVEFLGFSRDFNASIIFVIAWLFFYFLTIVIAKLLTGIFNLTGVNILLRFLGALFNVVKAVLIVIVVLTFVSSLKNDVFEETRMTETLTMVGSKVMKIYNNSLNENKIEINKEPDLMIDSFIIDDDFRYNLLER